MIRRETLEPRREAPPRRPRLLAGIAGAVERSGEVVTVALPCATPGNALLCRRSRWDAASTGATDRGRTGIERLRACARVSSTTPDAIAGLLESATFAMAALGVLQRCSTLELDGEHARATVRGPTDDAAIEEVARRLTLTCAVVRAVVGWMSRARSAPPADPEVRPAAPRVESAEGEPPWFEGPFVELVAIGLHRRSLEQLCAGRAPSTPPPIDRGYLLRILDEEVGRQFGHPLRPVVELILNASDALGGDRRTPGDGGPTIDVTLSSGRVEVVDRGAGMTLRAILSRLLVPFASDKRAGIEIGRFGVGFFSILAYAAADPRRFALEVSTGDGRQGWSLEVRAGAAGVDSFSCAIRRRPPTLGTRVVVTAPALEPDAIRYYLREMLHFFPPERALVRVDGEPLNDGAAIAGGRLFHDVVEPPRGDAPEAGASMTETPPRIGRFQLGGRAALPGITSATYHAGVKVEACLAISELALLDFPGAVELTEGRDAIKPGPWLDAVAAAFHRRLVCFAEDTLATRAARDRLAEVGAQVSAMLLSSAGWAEAAPALGRALLGPDRFLVGADRAESIIGFLGAGIAPRLFVPESFWAEREWQYFLPNERDLLERELELDPPESLAALAVRRTDLIGLVYVVARVANPGAVTVRLARRRRGRAGLEAAGALPCLGTRRAILIREDAGAVRAVPSWIQLYALRTAFARASGLRESDLEREIIVNEPVFAGNGGAR